MMFATRWVMPLSMILGVATVLAAEPDQVVIVGSFLPQRLARVTAPVTLITRQDLEGAGPTTLGEWLRALPFDNGGSPNPNNADGGSNPGYAALSLRAAGADSTLVLVNGRRIAPFAFSGVAVDLNSLPLVAIERIEVLRDGGSAMYGADAVAGVVNVVLRRSAPATELRLAGARTQHGGAGSLQASLTTGSDPTSDRRLHWLALVDLRKSEPLAASARDFARTSWQPGRGLDATSAIGWPGAYATDLSSPFVEFAFNGIDCDPSLYVGAIPADGQCRHDYPVLSWIVPRQQSASLFASGEWSLGTDTSVRGELLLADSRYRYRTSATPVWGGFSVSGEPFVLSADSPYNPAGSDVQVWTRTVELGARSSESSSLGYRLLAGLDWRVGGWTIDSTVGASGSRARLDLGSGHVSDGALRTTLASGTSMNPFGFTRSADTSALRGIELGGRARDAQAGGWWLDTRGHGEIGRLEGRPVTLAVGAEWRGERLRDSPSTLLQSGDVLGIASFSNAISGSRHVGAAYAELWVPAAAKLDLQASARMDRYSDFGSALSPRLAVAWRPAGWATVRASVSRAFRAPSLPDLHTAQVTGLSMPLDDPVRCPLGVAAPGAHPLSDCQVQFGQIGGGNPSLAPERAGTFAAGLTLSSADAARLSIGTWRIDKRGAVAFVRDATVLDPSFYAQLQHLVRRQAPTVEDLAHGLPGRIDAIDSTLQNIGRARYAGWDFELSSAPLRWNGTELVVSWIGALMTRAEQTLTEGAEPITLLDRSVNGTPVQRWRQSGSLLWRSGPWTLGVRAQYVDSYFDENPDPDGRTPRVGSWTTVALQGAITIGAHEVSIGIENVFDRKPPFSNKTSAFAVGWDDVVHDPRRRSFQLVWRYSTSGH